MTNFKKYIGKSICINRNNCPVYLFNVLEYNSNTRIFTAKQIVYSSLSSDLDVDNETCYEVDPYYDVINLVCDTPEELFTDIIRYMKEQIEYSSGLKLDEFKIRIHLS